MAPRVLGLQILHRKMAGAERCCCNLRRTSPSLVTCLLSILVVLTAQISEAQQANEQPKRQTEVKRDFRWPRNQVNILVDSKSFNQSELLTLNKFFQQLENKTCLQIKQLNPLKVNPFEPPANKIGGADDQDDRNFLYIFKSSIGAHNRHPSLGLSSFGCMRQGRQSVVLTDLAFRYPELILRYHLMRSLGVENIERPDGQVRKLLNILPLSQKIGSGEVFLEKQVDDNQRYTAIIEPYNPTFFAAKPAPNAEQTPLKASKLLLGRQVSQAPSKPSLFSDEDLAKIKQLYECSDLQNKLSPKPVETLLELRATTTTQASDLNEKLYSSPINQLTIKSQADTTADSQPTNLKQLQLKKLDEAEESLERIIDEIEKNVNNQTQPQQHHVNESLIDDAAKRIVDYLLTSEAVTPQPLQQQQQLPQPLQPQCQSLDSCPAPSLPLNQFQERPMILKLDDFHAQDPELKQANQMKLSQLGNDSLGSTYRLMNNNNNLDWLQPPLPAQQQQQAPQRPKSEMMISFEQSSAPNSNNPFDTLVNSQVLKLCSCSCQTMSPSPTQKPSLPPPSPSTDYPPSTSSTDFPPLTYPPIVYPPITYPPITYPPYTPITYPTYPTYPEYPPTQRPTFPTDGPPPTSTGPQTFPPPVTEPPFTWPPVTTTTLPPPPTVTETPTEIPVLTTTTLAPTTTPTPKPPPPTTQQPPPPGNNSHSQMIANACAQVEWVRPNKTVYGSAKIVWDVDRGNQNYFLCNNLKDGELIPGKTHGFSCKVSSQGKAFEMHNFNVLIKPEHVNLAWVQKNSQAFGKSNFPVIGGYSKQQDPYIVSRCLVKDENNDLITLIGYVNDQGVGWFPFDDIQIECSQYDVLACVS